MGMGFTGSSVLLGAYIGRMGLYMPGNPAGALIRGDQVTTKRAEDFTVYGLPVPVCAAGSRRRYRRGKPKTLKSGASVLVGTPGLVGYHGYGFHCIISVIGGLYRVYGFIYAG